MTRAHIIATESHRANLRGPHADPVWRYRSECVTCNLILSPWTDDETAQQFADSHQRFVGAA